MKKIVFCIFIALALANCGSKDKSGGGIPGTGLPELTDTQKQQVYRVNNGIQDMSALTEAQNPNSSSAGTFPDTTNSSDTLTKAQQELINQMDWAKQYNYCLVKIQGSEMSQASMTEPSLIQLSVSGSDCPISYNSSTKSTPSVSGSSYNTVEEATEEFQINPFGVLNFNLDVLSSKTTSKAVIKVTGLNEKQLQVNTNITAKMTSQSKSSGTVVSDLVVNTSVTQEFPTSSFENLVIKNMRMTLTGTQTFADFKVVAYIVMNVPEVKNSSTIDMEKFATFYINGKKVSAAEFSQVFGNIVTVLE